MPPTTASMFGLCISDSVVALDVPPVLLMVASVVVSSWTVVVFVLIAVDVACPVAASGQYAKHDIAMSTTTCPFSTILNSISIVENQLRLIP